LCSDTRQCGNIFHEPVAAITSGDIKSSMKISNYAHAAYEAEIIFSRDYRRTYLRNEISISSEKLCCSWKSPALINSKSIACDKFYVRAIQANYKTLRFRRPRNWIPFFRYGNLLAHPSAECLVVRRQRSHAIITGVKYPAAAGFIRVVISLQVPS